VPLSRGRIRHPLADQWEQEYRDQLRRGEALKRDAKAFYATQLGQPDPAADRWARDGARGVPIEPDAVWVPEGEYGDFLEASTGERRYAPGTQQPSRA
jgi:hypothetical protein